jgi:hypothetical protein
MNKAILAAAVGGIAAGAAACSTTPEPQIPGAPAVDPEGAVVANEAPASPAKAEKMACGAGMMKGSEMQMPPRAPEPKAPATQPAAPAPSGGSPKSDKHACGGVNGCGAKTDKKTEPKQ